MCLFFTHDPIVSSKPLFSLFFFYFPNAFENNQSKGAPLCTSFYAPSEKGARRHQTQKILIMGWDESTEA